MVFSAPVFLFCFLPLVLATYFAAPLRWRNAVLLVASLAFYAFGEGRTVLVLVGCCLASWALGLRIARAATTTRARRLVAVAVVLNLALLVWYKYAAFLADGVNRLLAALDVPGLVVNPVMALPAGISFVTFHAISYVVDVRRGDAEARRNPLDVVLYVVLFPQLIAGPIVRWRHFAAQLHTRAVTLDDFAAGVQRFAVGLGKKVLLADTIGVTADELFALPASDLTAGLAWLAAVCFALQVYFDYSGYSDMALGLGRMFGFRFLENFDYPYVARSATELWRRWNVSLSSWFRDYVYLPLGGRHGRWWRADLNLVVVFLLTGLWHGAGWPFVLFGAYFGVVLVLERRFLLAPLARTWRPLAHGYLLVVWLVGCVLFRADGVAQIEAMLGAMVGLGAGGGGEYHAGLYLTPRLVVAMMLGAVAACPIVPWWHRRRRALLAEARGAALETSHALATVAAVAALLLASLATLAAGTHQPFLYFRF